MSTASKSIRPDKRAFSLLEILVAMVILALIVIALAAISTEAGRIWKMTEALNQRRSTGRALLQFIARDLEMAVRQLPYPQSNAPNLHFVANEPSLIPTTLLNPHAAFWQAPVAADRSKGDLAEIGYFVRWDTTTQPGTAKAQLCRFFVDPADDTHYRVYSSDEDGKPVNWLESATINQVAPATAPHGYRGWFADNVIALWLRCLDKHGDPILKTAAGTSLNGGCGFDSRQGFEITSTGLKQTGPALPTSVEVVLVTVDDHLAKKITAPLLASPGSPENFWKDRTTTGSLAHFVAGLPPEIRPGVQVFSTRVVLKASFSSR